MGITNKKTLTKTRRKTRDVDQTAQDILSPSHLKRYRATKASEELPGLGRHYCTPCAKWFETAHALDGHLHAKPHKRRLKQLADGVYSQQEAEAAVGIYTDNGPQTKIHQQPLRVTAETVPVAEAAEAGPARDAAVEVTSASDTMATS